MAAVFRAHDRRLGRSVALKVLQPQLATDDALVRRFRREAELAAGLSTHPNVVSVYDVVDDGPVHAIVMELVEGRTLKDLVAEEGPFSVLRAFALGDSIAAALQLAHQCGLTHRDVKPQNVLIGQDGQVKVTDFGIARGAETTRVTQPGAVWGSAAYLSPEQATGDEGGPASDIYSLGVVLYEMLTGRLPFLADHPATLALQHLREEPPSPMALEPAVSSAAAGVVLRTLAKRPEDRFASMAELRDAMRRATLDGGSAAAPRARGRGPEARSRSREPWLLLGLTLAVAAGAGWAALGPRSGADIHRHAATIRHERAVAPTSRPAVTNLRQAPAPTAVPPTPLPTVQPTAVPTAMVVVPAPAPPLVVRWRPIDLPRGTARKGKVLHPDRKDGGHGKHGDGKDHGDG